MSRAQKIALVVIWLGILGSIAAVLFSWQVRREWMVPGGYMLVRRNLLTAEADVLISGQWVPLPGFRRSGPTLLAKQPPPSGEPPETDPNQPALPTRAPAPDLLGEPDHSLQQAKVPPAPRVRPRAPVRVKITPDPPESDAAALPAEDGYPSSAPPVSPDLPVVRAPSPDEVPAVAAPPSPPPDKAAATDNGATVSASDQSNPAAAAPDQTQQATAPPCDPTVPGATC